MKSLERESYFCKNFKNRCISPFYGFLVENGILIGFIYEFLSNGPISSCISSNSDKSNEIYSLMSINRIFQSISYLHSNNLIYRDLKPLNILVDHDSLPFLSDFETIRHPDDDDNNEIVQMTGDIGSPLYISPEQEQEERNISFPTDIYSFGLVVYYLIEHKDKLLQKRSSLNNQMKNASPNLQNLHNLCVKYKQEERPTEDEIKTMIIKEINSFDCLEKYLKNDKSKISKSIIIQFILENIIIQLENPKELFDYIKKVLDFKSIFISKFKDDFNKTEKDYSNYCIDNFIQNLFNKSSTQQSNSNALFNLGNVYFYGDGVKCNFRIAKEYYELAAELNNSDAFNNLGLIYFSGYGVKIYYSKALKYFELGAKDNNVNSLVNLGNMYFKGNGVEQDFIKARHYYLSAAEQNEPNSLNNLELIYYYGLGIEQNFQTAKHFFELAAQQNISEAFLNLGNIFFLGNGVKKDYKKAKEYYEKASQLNNSFAHLNLAYIYKKGYGVKKDMNKAIQYYTFSANCNNSYAFLKLGELYYDGDDVKQDYIKAKDYYEISAKLNNSIALFYLGNLYFYGYGVEKDYQQAKFYFEISAQLNNSDSLNLLGIIYIDGLGVDKNITKAREYFILSAKLNNKDAYLNLGIMYENGIGVNKNYLIAMQFYKISGELNNSDGFLCLGNLYFNGFGVKCDYLKAKYYYEQSAQFDNPNALLNLGNIYFYGYGVKQNYEKSREYFEKSAYFGNQNALFNLGIFYQYGFGVCKDYLKAKKMYEELIKINNNSASLVQLGHLYKDGFGIEKDILRAKYYYELSAKQNDTAALNNIGELYYNGEGVKQDYLKAKYYYELSANLSDSYALLCLGKLYKNGEGVKQDYLKAMHYYELSSKQNNSDAFYYLGEMYFKGIGVEKDLKKARKNYEYSAQLNNSLALFHLASYYSNGDIFDKDIQKAIEYYLKCIDMHYEKIIINHSYYIRYNIYYYRSNNDLGLIYLIDFQNIEKATEYLKEAGLNEYPYGQNNFGLINQFYLDKIENAEYLYERSSKHKFAPAEFNLGHLKEKDGKIKESIKYYKNAVKHENESLIFHNHNHFDKRLEISKMFILCFTNLKLTEYYLSKSKYNKSREYFIKAFAKLQSDENGFVYKFHFILQENKSENIFSYLKDFIFNFPLFNFNDQYNKEYCLPNERKTSSDKIDMDNFLKKLKVKNSSSFDEFVKQNETVLQLNIKSNPIIDNENSKNVLLETENESKMIFKDAGKLFDFIIKNNKIKNLFVDEIQNIIYFIEKMLYTPPYNILFGRISIEKKKINDIVKHKTTDLDESFYEGFGLEECKLMN